MLSLNFGSGSKKKVGWVNCDVDSSTNPDVVMDLNTVPYPFASHSVDSIELDNVMEHLHLPLPVFLLEIRRILKRNATVHLVFPNFFRWKARLHFLEGKLDDADGWEVNHSLLISPSEFQAVVRQFGFAVSPKATWVQDLVWVENNIVLRKREDC